MIGRWPVVCVVWAMCLYRKQILNAIACLALLLTLTGAPAEAQREAQRGMVSGIDTESDIKSDAIAAANTAGSIMAGTSHGGVISQLYVTAPPGWSYQVERVPGSFVDCGQGIDARTTDHNGRDSAPLVCGVTITETLVIPAASTSARLVVHY